MLIMYSRVCTTPGLLGKTVKEHVRDDSWEDYDAPSAYGTALIRLECDFVH
jgi:hypothetical protein